MCLGRCAWGKSLFEFNGSCTLDLAGHDGLWLLVQKVFLNNSRQWLLSLRMSMSPLLRGLGVGVRECFSLFLCWYTCCTVFSAFSCTYVGGLVANLLELRFLPEHQIVFLRVFNYCGGNASEALFLVFLCMSVLLFVVWSFSFCHIGGRREASTEPRSSWSCISI